jgi:hypothetical protein
LPLCDVPCTDWVVCGDFGMLGKTAAEAALPSTTQRISAEAANFRTFIDNLHLLNTGERPPGLN